MTNFQASLKELLKEEGFWSDDPIDSGGETLYGISRKHWPEWEGWTVFEHLVQNAGDQELESTAKAALMTKVESFYFKNFWSKLSLDSIPMDIARMLFSMAVNVGTDKAAKSMQESCNFLGLYLRGDAANEVVVDGVIGPKTLSEFTANVSSNSKLVRLWIRECWGAHYINICANYPKNLKYFVGWMNRKGKY